MQALETMIILMTIVNADQTFANRMVSCSLTHAIKPPGIWDISSIYLSNHDQILCSQSSHLQATNCTEQIFYGSRYQHPIKTDKGRNVCSLLFIKLIWLELWLNLPWQGLCPDSKLYIHALSQNISMSLLAMSVAVNKLEAPLQLQEKPHLADQERLSGHTWYWDFLSASICFGGSHCLPQFTSKIGQCPLGSPILHPKRELQDRRV